MPDTPNTQQFAYRTINVPDADILGPDGTVINDLSPGQPRGGQITQWMDEELASAWVAEANRVMGITMPFANPILGLSDTLKNIITNAIASRTPVTSPSVISATVNARRQAQNASNPPDVYQGQNPLYRAMYAIMQAYNAMNIPWYSDPEAVRLWRKYISGPPQPVGNTTLTSEFGQHNFNDGWFVSVTNHPEWPGLGSSDPSSPYRSGIVSDRIFDLIKSMPEFGAAASRTRDSSGYVYPVPTTWPYIRIPGYAHGLSSLATLDPTYFSTVENTFVMGGFVDERLLGHTGEYVWETVGFGNPDQNILYPPTAAYRYVSDPSNPPLDPTTRSVIDFAYVNAHGMDWRLYSYSNPVVGSKVIGVPTIFYADWLNEWANSLASRSVDSIVIAARAYTAYENFVSSSADGFGSATSFIMQATNLSSIDLNNLLNGASQSTLRAAAAAAASLGAAISAIPGTYGIPALIGGAIAAALYLTSISVRNNVSGFRDELGRFKPIVQRGWLAGDSTDPNNGIPILQVPAPSGWSRPLRAPAAVRAVLSTIHPAVPSAVTSAFGVQPGSSQAAPMSFGAKAVIAIGIAAGAIYIGSKMFSGKVSTFTKTTTRTSGRRTRSRSRR